MNLIFESEHAHAQLEDRQDEEEEGNKEGGMAGRGWADKMPGYVNAWLSGI